MEALTLLELRLAAVMCLRCLCIWWDAFSWIVSTMDHTDISDMDVYPSLRQRVPPSTCACKEEAWSCRSLELPTQRSLQCFPLLPALPRHSLPCPSGGTVGPCCVSLCHAWIGDADGAPLTRATAETVRGVCVCVRVFKLVCFLTFLSPVQWLK